MYSAHERSTPASGGRDEVAAAAAAAVAALPGLQNIISVPLDGGGTRFTATLTREALAKDALQAAFAQGLDIRRFEVKEPTLHDAFIVLTGGEVSQ